MLDKFQIGVHVADVGGEGDRWSHLQLRRFRSVRVVVVVVVSSSHLDVEEGDKVGLIIRMCFASKVHGPRLSVTDKNRIIRTLVLN